MAVRELLPNELGSAPVVADLKVYLGDRVASLKKVQVTPGLGILSNNPSHKPSVTYIGKKRDAAHGLGMAVYSDEGVNPSRIDEVIERYNRLEAVHGFLLQLPALTRAGSGEIASDDETKQIVRQIAAHKDVDGLGPDSHYSPATKEAVFRLMDYHEVPWREGLLAILGEGPLVGAPSCKHAQEQGAEVVSFNKHSDPEEVRKALNAARVIITATGDQTALTPDMFDSSRVRTIIDAGAAEKGRGGDVSSQMRAFANEHGWPITPEVGGVGPLTVYTLLGNVVSAAELMLNPVATVPISGSGRMNFPMSPSDPGIIEEILAQKS